MFDLTRSLMRYVQAQIAHPNHGYRWLGDREGSEMEAEVQGLDPPGGGDGVEAGAVRDLLATAVDLGALIITRFKALANAAQDRCHDEGRADQPIAAMLGMQCQLFRSVAWHFLPSSALSIYKIPQSRALPALMK